MSVVFEVAERNGEASKLPVVPVRLEVPAKQQRDAVIEINDDEAQRTTILALRTRSTGSWIIGYSQVDDSGPERRKEAADVTIFPNGQALAVRRVVLGEGEDQDFAEDELRDASAVTFALSLLGNIAEVIGTGEQQDHAHLAAA